MPQPPFKVDALQVEPGSGDSLLIERDVTGALKFTDAVTTGGILLHQLAGLQAIDNVLTVGKAGVGAQFTTIQSALDAVPSTSSPVNPYLILVAPGEYKETVNVFRDGVILFGLGQVILRSALEDTPNAPGNDHTLILSSQLGTTPEKFEIHNFLVSNAHNGKACIRVVGGPGSTVGQGGISLHNCSLQAVASGGNRTLWSTACNIVSVFGGDWGGNTQSITLVEEVASLEFRGVFNLGAISLRYDTVNDQPADFPTSYLFENCTLGVGTALSPSLSLDLDGASSAEFKTTGIQGPVTFSGDRPVQITNSRFVGNLTILETVQVTSNSNFLEGTLNTNATAIFDTPMLRGTVNFAGVTSVAVVFKIPLVNAEYQVLFTPDTQPANDETPWVTNKLSTGFTINFATAQALNVDWMSIRRPVV